jgi:hypothetical protein
MQYDLVIKRTLREAQGILWANLPPASNLPDAQAVKSLGALIRTPQGQQVLERGNDTALCFVLRAVNRILSDKDQPDRVTISRLWEVLDEPELNRALGIRQNSRMILGRKKPPAWWPRAPHSGFSCEWPGLMISVKATAPFKRDLKNLGWSLMDQKTFSIVAGVIFAAVALFHLVRIYMDWPVMIGGWSVPMWVSWIGLVVAGGLGRRRPSFSIAH